MSPARLAVILLPLLLMVPHSPAAIPTDDDAGSGRDAGDDPEAAVPIVPGYHTGHLTPVVDERDFYVFTAEAGTFLDIAWDHASEAFVAHAWIWGPGPDGSGVHVRTQDVFAGLGALYYTVPRTGTWYLSFTLDRHDPEATPLAYEFRLEMRAHKNLAAADSTDAPLALEARVERSEELYFSIRQDLIQYKTDHHGALIGALEWDLTFDDTSHIGMYFAAGGAPKTSGTIDRVEVGGTPVAEIPFPIETRQGTDWIELRAHITNVSGTLRFYALDAHAEVWGEIVVSATGALEAASGEGGEVTIWTTEDVADGDDVLVPGHATTNGGTLDVSVDGPYLGVFDTRGNPGRVVAPNGTTFELGPETRTHWLLDPPHGDWRLELDRTTRTEPFPDELFFVGARLPSLGVLAPVDS